MEEDIKILEEMITWDCLLPNKRQTEAIENLIKEFKKIKIENIEYKIGQMPDTSEEYKTFKKELEKWKSGEM